MTGNGTFADERQTKEATAYYATGWGKSHLLFSKESYDTVASLHPFAYGSADVGRIWVSPLSRGDRQV
jgi:hypothetical protein